MATEDPPFLFACQGCGAREFLIRGRCATCAPESHAEWNAGMAAYEADAAAFKAHTGKEPLEAWDAFEAWINTRAAAAGDRLAAALHRQRGTP